MKIHRRKKMYRTIDTLGKYNDLHSRQERITTRHEMALLYSIKKQVRSKLLINLKKVTSRQYLSQLCIQKHIQKQLMYESKNIPYTGP